MKLHFWDLGALRPGWRNFGDHLNPWLWPRLLPNTFGDEDDTVFVGIGSLLNDKLGPFRRTVVFGAGHGYGEPPRPDSSWTIYFVRGPLTARALGLGPEKAIADPALLIRRVLDTSGISKQHDASFMPHFSSLLEGEATIRRACSLSGLHFIDPRVPVDDVLRELAQTRLLIAEAMHGAIAADALRVPWIPVRAGPHILGFKWRDWCASMGLELRQRRLWGVPRLRGWAPRSARLDAGVLALELSLARRARPFMSDDHHLERRLTAMEEQLARLQSDLAAGRFVAPHHNV